MLGLSLSLIASTAHAAPPKPKGTKARKQFDTAVQLYTDGDYDGAAVAAKSGYEIEAHESLLFIWAQAERQRGDCAKAVELLERFIETTQIEAMKANAETPLEICREQLAAEQAAREAELEAAREIEPIEEPMEEPVEEPIEPTPARPWHRDPLGGVLVGVGGAGVLTGGALLVAAVVLDPDTADDYGSFDRRRQVQPRLFLAGGIAAGVGVLVAGAGALRWGLLARKNKRQAATARVQMAPWLDPARAGVVLSGRF